MSSRIQFAKADVVRLFYRRTQAKKYSGIAFRDHLLGKGGITICKFNSVMAGKPRALISHREDFFKLPVPLQRILKSCDILGFTLCMRLIDCADAP